MNSCYRSAVVLNNMGVRMLERGLYQHAYLTLRASVDFMRQFINRCYGQMLHYEDEIQLASEIHQELRRARERLSEDSLTPPALFIETVSYEGPHNHTPMKSASWRTMNSPISIRIDTLSSFPDERSDTDLESAIMLFNFGVSHFCLSKTKDDSSPELQCSFELFQMAYEMVAGDINGFWDFDADDLESVPLVLARVLVGAYSLKTMADVLESTGYDKEASKLERSLNKIMVVVDDLEESSESSFDSIAASAA